LGIFFKQRLILFCEGEGDGGGGVGGGGTPPAGDGGGGGGAGDGGGGGGEKPWFDSLPPELATNPSIVKFKKAEDLAKSYVHLQGQIGKNRVAIPGNDAKPEEWDNFFKTVGRPDDPTAYEFEEASEYPEGLRKPKELQDKFRKWAHKTGLSAGQAKKLWGEMEGHIVESYKNQSGTLKAENEKVWGALKTEWGGNYDTRKGLAQKAFAAVNRALGKDNAMPSQLLQNPRYLRAFAHIGEMAAEDRLGDAKGAPADYQSTNEMVAKIKELQASDAYWNAKHPGHKKTKQEVAALYAKAYPDEK
jgi:hypothetical protein